METWTAFIDRIGRHFGETDSEHLESRVAETLCGIGRYLPEFDRKHIKLPAKAARHLLSADIKEGELDIDSIGEELNMPPGQSREFVESVLAAIDEHQIGEARKHWIRNLPEKVVEALVTESTAPATSVGSRTGQTLSEGVPGSSTPLSTANPGHHNSPVSDGEPRGDTKLSTSRGTTQERTGRTLAQGSPGSSTPLNEGD